MKKGRELAALLILALALFLTACGTTGSEEPDMGNGSDDGDADKEVTAMLEQVENNFYRYTVNNQTAESMTFEFTSGQRYDFTISNEAGEELHRLSSVSTYIQALGEETIEPGEKLEYEFEIPPLELDPGIYQLTAWLTPKDGQQFEAETDFTVE